jgi:hypothetical protein
MNKYYKTACHNSRYCIVVKLLCLSESLTMILKLRIKRGTITAHQVISCLIVNALVISPVQAETVSSAQTIRTTTSVTLQHWLNRNVDNHPAALAAESAVDSANYQLVAADKALYNPELEFEAETAETDSASIGLSQKIDWGDTRGARTEMVGFRRTAAQFNFESVRRELAVKFLSGLADYHTSDAFKVLAMKG